MFYSQFPVGTIVTVVRSTSFYGDKAEGLYKVVKANKVRVTVERLSDGYSRTFSNRTGFELNEFATQRVRLEPHHFQIEHDARVVAKQADQEFWNQIEAAVRNRSRSALVDLLSK